MGAYYSASRFLASVVCGALSGMEVRGKENIPRTGGLIIASNHISYWDPPLVGAAFTREVHYLAKEELFQKPVLGTLLRSVNCIPIRRGAADLKGLSRAIAVLERGGGLVLFPEGSRIKDGELHSARPGVGLLAVQADVPIVPCYISGSNQSRKWLTRAAHVRISFGRMQGWRALAGSEADAAPGRMLYQRIGESVMREIAALKSDQERSASRGAA